MGASMAITDSWLRSIEGKPYDGPKEITDGDGLGVRITDKGRVTFQVRHAVYVNDERRQIRTTIGRYPAVTLKQARIRAAEIKEGGLEVEVNSDEPPIQILIDEWMDKYVMRECREGTQVNYTYNFRGIAKFLPKKPLNKIGMEEWLKLFDTVSERSPGYAYSLLKNIKACLNWHIRRGSINPPAMMSLRSRDVGLSSKIGTRVFTIQEVAKIWRGIESSRAGAENKIIHQLCLLYGCRLSEARQVRRQDLDWEAMVWTVPSEFSKTGRPIRRPITEIGKALFERGLLVSGHEEWLFEGRVKGQPIDIHSCNRLVMRLRADLGIPYWKTHDTRRTLSTRLSEMGILPHVTETMLGHTLSGVMAVYNKHDWLADQRDAYEQWWQMIKQELMSGS